MKTIILFNTINRPEMMFNTIRANILNSGTNEIEVICTNNGGTDETHVSILRLIDAIKPIPVHYTRNIDNIGNSPSLNNMLKFGSENITGIGYIAVLGDDIEMPDNWLIQAQRKFDEMKNLEIKPGIIGFDWGNLKKDKEPFHEILQCYTPGRVFGCWVFPYEIFDKLGYFVELSKYGLWDSEFNLRVSSAGYISCYLNGYDSKHIGADAGTKSDYRLMKNEELQKASILFNKAVDSHPAKVEWDNRKIE